MSTGGYSNPLDSTALVQTPTTYSQMSYDLFTELNSLRTNPTAYHGTVTGAAQTVTQKFIDAGAKTALTWSLSLSYAALEYANAKGTGKITNEGSAFLHGRNIYTPTICSPVEFETTHNVNT